MSAPHDPFGWLVDMLTEAYGKPSLQPPETLDAASLIGRAHQDNDGLIWWGLLGFCRRAWTWETGTWSVRLRTDQGNDPRTDHGGDDWSVVMSRGSRQVQFRNSAKTWDGLTRNVIEPAARWVYDLPALSQSAPARDWRTDPLRRQMRRDHPEPS